MGCGMFGTVWRMTRPLLASLALLLAVLACTKTTPTPVVVAVTPQPTVTASATAVQTVTAVQTSAPRFVTVRGDWYCREAASVGADIIGYVYDGDVVEIVQISGGWTQVRIGEGKLCWLAGW